MKFAKFHPKKQFPSIAQMHSTTWPSKTSSLPSLEQSRFRNMRSYEAFAFSSIPCSLNCKSTCSLADLFTIQRGSHGRLTLSMMQSGLAVLTAAPRAFPAAKPLISFFKQTTTLKLPHYHNYLQCLKKFKPSLLITDLECARLVSLEMMLQEPSSHPSSEDQDTLVLW